MLGSALKRLGQNNLLALKLKHLPVDFTFSETESDAAALGRSLDEFQNILQTLDTGELSAMMSSYHIELPESAFSSLKMEPEAFITEMKYAAVIKWYEMGDISQGKAAEIAGLSRFELIALLKRYKVSVIQYTEKHLMRELENARR